MRAMHEIFDEIRGGRPAVKERQPCAEQDLWQACLELRWGWPSLLDGFEGRASLNASWLLVGCDPGIRTP